MAEYETVRGGHQSSGNTLERDTGSNAYKPAPLVEYINAIVPIREETIRINYIGKKTDDYPGIHYAGNLMIVIGRRASYIEAITPIRPEPELINYIGKRSADQSGIHYPDNQMKTSLPVIEYEGVVAPTVNRIELTLMTGKKATIRSGEEPVRDTGKNLYKIEEEIAEIFYSDQRVAGVTLQRIKTNVHKQWNFTRNALAGIPALKEHTSVQGLRSAGVGVQNLRIVGSKFLGAPESLHEIKPLGVSGTVELVPFYHNMTAHDNNGLYPEWDNYVEYKINNYPGSGYICILTIPRYPGMASDYRDIRFSDGNYPLYYWVESYTDTTATVRVRLGTSAKVFLYYGNGSAKSESSAENTFDFFDDFDTLDANKWTTVSGTVSVSDSILSMTAITTVQAVIRSVKNILWSNVVVESKAKVDANHRVNFGSSYTRSFLYDDGTTWYIFNDSTETSVATGSATAPTTGVYGIAKVVYTTSSIIAYWNGTQVISTTNVDLNNRLLNLRHWYQGTANWDWIRVYKYTATDPTAEIVSGGYRSNVRRIAAVTTGSNYFAASDISVKNVKSLGSAFSWRERESSAFVQEIGEILDLDHYDFTRASSLNIQKSYNKVTRIGNHPRSSGTSLTELMTNVFIGTAYYVDALMSIAIPNTYALRQINRGRASSISVASPKEKVTRLTVFHRPSLNSVTKLKINEGRVSGHPRNSSVFSPTQKMFITRLKGQYRDSSVYSQIFEENNEYNMIYLRYAYVSTLIESIFNYSTCGLSRTSSVFLYPKVDSEKALAFIRNSDFYLQKSLEDIGHKTEVLRFGNGSFLPAPSFDVTRISHVLIGSDEEIPEIAVQTQRWECDYGRNSSIFVDSVQGRIVPVGNYFRPGSLEIPYLSMLAEEVHGKYREVAVEIPTIETWLTRASDKFVSSAVAIPLLENLTETSGSFIREVSTELQPVNTEAVKEGNFRRSSDAAVTIIESIAERGVAASRISDLFVNNLSINLEALKNLVRQVAVDIPAPCMIALGAANYDHPHSPFKLGITKDEYGITITVPEYGISLNKNLFYLVIRDGESMIEITQYDTDTFTAEIQDTDPITGELRPMPLSDRTVKAVLKGGSPTTEVVVDCTVVEDGKISFSLTTSNTATPGRYVPKFVVLGENFRKELPEKQEEFQELLINDASYSGE